MTYTKFAGSSLVSKRSVGTVDRRLRHLGTGMNNRNEHSQGQEDIDSMLILKATLRVEVSQRLAVPQEATPLIIHTF